MPPSIPPTTRTTSDDARPRIELLPVPAVARGISPTSGSTTGADLYFAAPRSSPAGRVPLKTLVLILLGGVALFVLSARRDFLLGQLAAPVLTIGALHGLLRGGFRKIIMLAATIGVLYAMATGADALNAYLQSRTSLVNPVWSWLLIILAAVLVLVLISAMVKSFRRRVIMRRPFTRGADRLLGVLVGLAEGALVILTVCWMVVEVKPYTQQIRDRQDVEAGSYRQALATRMVRLADEAGTGDLGRLVAATNPIDDVPEIRKVIDELNTKGEISLDSLGNLDPETIQRLNDLLKQTTGQEQGGLNQLIETHQQGSESRDQARGQLPPPGPAER
ncbi:MAG TPA: CvpA family protein [Phycisphaerae bacterium]|nr:CvpA family protein [Phycisphaerae bacterium]